MLPKFNMLSSLFTQVHKWVPVTYCWGGGEPCNGLATHSGGVEILLGASCQ